MECCFENSMQSVLVFYCHLSWSKSLINLKSGEKRVLKTLRFKYEFLRLAIHVDLVLMLMTVIKRKRVSNTLIFISGSDDDATVINAFKAFDEGGMINGKA